MPCLGIKLRGGTAALIMAVATTAAAHVASGVSAVASLETVSPTAGTLVVPPASTAAPITLDYSGATDEHSALQQVELHFRTESSAWQPTGLSSATASGTFEFTPPGSPPANHGIYYFDIVAADVLGNTSSAPTGMNGTGQGATDFGSTTVGEWWVLQ